MWTCVILAIIHRIVETLQLAADFSSFYDDIEQNFIDVLLTVFFAWYAYMRMRGKYETFDLLPRYHLSIFKAHEDQYNQEKVYRWGHIKKKTIKIGK